MLIIYKKIKNNKNKDMKNMLFMYMFISMCIVFLPAQAQQTQTHSHTEIIRDAGATATRGVVRNSEDRVPPDSLHWKRGGDVSISFSQMSLSYWAAGGEPSLSFGSALNLFANYKKDKNIWENYAYVAYGIIKAGEREAVKNRDQVNVGSRIGREMTNDWYYTLAMLGKTQLAPGYRYTSTDTIYNSNLFAPAYMFLSLGLDYKPSDRLSISLSPAMGKATFVNSTDTIVLSSSGIASEKIREGKRSRYEFGGGIVFNLNGSLFEEKATYSSQLELFSNYFDKPQNVDVVWDFKLRILLTQHISTGINLHMIYYDNQKTFIKDADGKITEHGPKLQVKQFFEVGLFFGF